METNKLSELSNEELLKRKKTTRFVSGLLFGAISALIVLNLFNIINGDQHWGVLAVPVGLMPILIINYNSVREINKELKSRNL